MSLLNQKKLLIAVGTMLTTIILPFSVVAQTPGNFETVSLRTNPEFPTAYQNVTVSAESGTTDLSGSFLTWFLNGTQAASGIGMTSFSFKTSGFGVASEIILSVKTQSGDTIQQGLEVRPANVNINYEALSYVPPFYKGKALYSYQTPLRVVAIPELADENGNKIGSESLLFSWQVNDALQQNLSGLGKDTAVLRAQIPMKETAVTVTVSSLDGRMNASKRINIQPIMPQIVLYQSSPLYGLLFNSALADSKQLTGQEMTITAVPYFFDTASPQTNMLYTWNMNNSVIGSEQSQNFITVRQVSNNAGTSNISVSAKHTRDMFEYGNASISITFGQAAKVGAF